MFLEERIVNKEVENEKHDIYEDSVYIKLFAMKNQCREW